MQSKFHENESKFQLSERKRNDTIKLIQDELQNEKKVGIHLRKKLNECVDELQELRSLENQLAQSLTGNEKSVIFVFLFLLVYFLFFIIVIIIEY